MKKDEYFNMAMSRFDEAVEFHNLIKTIELRFHDNPVRPILVQLLSSLRDDALSLGLQEYKNFTEWKEDGILEKQELAVTGGTTTNTPV